MPRKFNFLFVFLVVSPFIAFCQDLHSSNYDYNPMYINPAETGGFLGTVRINASHRDQFDAFIEKGFNRQIAQVDMPLTFNFLKNGWFGYGLGILNDQSGDLGFQNSGAVFSLAYHYPLDKKNRQVIAFGGQIGRLQRSLRSTENALFGDVLVSGGISSDLNLIDQFSESYSNYNFGLSYKNTMNKRTKFVSGVSVYHTFSNTQKSFTNNRLHRRFNAYVTVPFFVNKKVILEPRLYTSFIGNAYNVNLQSLTRFNYQNKLQLSGGLGYRLQDAVQFLFGIEYKGWDVGLSYDVTVSTARLYNNGRGAIELGLRKIFVLTKTPKIDPVLICPRL